MAGYDYFSGALEPYTQKRQEIGKNRKAGQITVTESIDTVDKGKLTPEAVAKLRSEDPVMSDAYVKTLTSLLGDDTSINLQGVIQNMIGEGPEDIKKMYEESGVLDLADKARQGYTAQEKEAITSQKRQELAMSARAGAGTRGGLRGQTSDYGVAQQQFKTALGQAQSMQQIATEEQARKDKAEEQYANLSLAIAEKQKSEEDRYRNMLKDISMDLANTISITK